MNEYCKTCKTTKLIPLLEEAATVGTLLYCPSCGRRFLAGVEWYPEKDKVEVSGFSEEDDARENR